LGENLGRLGEDGGEGVEEWIGLLDGLREDYCWRKTHGVR
jgi:hypothetical protein